MTTEMSKTQIDRLGDRLKKGNITDSDLRLLDLYRLSFHQAHGNVIWAIREKLGLNPTGRPSKSTKSISEKLRRESIRLTQIQDIAGCRLTVSDIVNQDSVVKSLRTLFGNTAAVIDRRKQPSHGYRAVHLIVSYGGKLIEIQVRTGLQHRWAELSEKFSDVLDPAIKYGGGDARIREILASFSTEIGVEESLEGQIAELQNQAASLNGLPANISESLENFQQAAVSQRQLMLKSLRDTIELTETLRGEKNAFFD